MKNKVLKIAVGIIVLLIAVYIINAFNPDLSKKFYQLFKKDLTEQQELSKKKYDSIQGLRQKEYLNYLDLLKEKDQEIISIEQALLLQQQKAYKYEKELANYRRGNFDERFSKFSSLVKKDTLE